MVMHDAFQRAFLLSWLASSRLKLDIASKKLQTIFNQSPETSSPVQELPSHVIIRTWWGVKISPSYVTAHTVRPLSHFLNVFPPGRATFHFGKSYWGLHPEQPVAQKSWQLLLALVQEKIIIFQTQSKQ